MHVVTGHFVDQTFHGGIRYFVFTVSDHDDHLGAGLAHLIKMRDSGVYWTGVDRAKVGAVPDNARNEFGVAVDDFEVIGERPKPVLVYVESHDSDAVALVRQISV